MYLAMNPPTSRVASIALPVAFATSWVAFAVSVIGSSGVHPVGAGQVQGLLVIRRAWRGRSVHWWRRPLQRPVRPVMACDRMCMNPYVLNAWLMPA
jgi:hypothetical protein